MKKLITLFVAAVLCFSTANAQHYRGFADVTLTIPVAVKMGGENISYETAKGFFPGFTTTHGVQLKNFFVGAGVGAFLTPSLDYSCLLTGFIDGRYDFFNMNKANLFIDCKLGYPIIAGDGDVDMVEPNGDDFFIGEAKCTAPYFNPSVGVRFRFSKNCGINIALGYWLRLLILSNEETI